MAINVFAFMIFILMLLACCLLIFNRLTGLSRIQKGTGLILILFSDVILVLEIASLFKVFNKYEYILVIQGIVTAGFAIANRVLKIGIPKKILKKNYIAFLDGLTYFKTHKIFTLLTIFVSINWLFLAICILIFPQNITDSLYNHLSRIGYWIQQGSLDHYAGFNAVGMMYPYNNSLLMAPPIIFIKTDMFSGFIQFLAAILCLLCVYGISRVLGNKREGSLISALLLLTYCVIIFESITAQNDLLAAAFISLSIYFLISAIQAKKVNLLFFAFLALSLAIGTNQYSLLVLPGFGLLFIYGLFSIWMNKRRLIFQSLGILAILFLCFGSYAYIQNLVNFGSIFGPKGFVEATTNISDLAEIPQKIGTNSSRLFAQFISCDGLPPQLADFCLDTKGRFLRPILPDNIESGQYLYGTARFNLNNQNVYNAEMAWFGPLSWILILPSIVFTIVKGIRKKNALLILFLMIPLSFFFFIQFAKFGWDPYQGRYLISSVVLLQPLTSWIYSSPKIGGKIFSAFLCVVGLLIMFYSTLNNASLPLTSKAMLVDLEKWGMNHSSLIKKTAYKLKPWMMYDLDVWRMDRIEIMTISNREFYEPVKMVEQHIALDERLGIISDFNEFPDYLFRGKEVRRYLTRVTIKEFREGVLDLDFLLVAPEFKKEVPIEYYPLDQINDWVILKLN